MTTNMTERNKSLAPLWMYANYDYKKLLYHWIMINLLLKHDATIEPWKLKRIKP